MKILKTKMIEKGMSQIELAAKLGVHDSSVSKWIKWEVPIPLKHKKKICEIFDIDIFLLEGGRDHVD